MYKYIFIILIFSISFSNHGHRCGFMHHALNEPESRVRPETDTFAVSPSGHFYIHYDLSGNDAPILDDNNSNGVPDYIDEVGIIADSSRYVLVDIMGFLPEPSDGDGVYDIYIDDLGPGYYGVNILDSDFTEGQSYIKIDDEYESGDYYIPGINTMRLTVAHEFFHAIQRAYRIYPSSSTGFFYEMSSTWIEDVIVPDGDDYLNWTDQFFNDADKSITSTDGYSIALYGHYLASVIDGESDPMQSSIIKNMWEKFSAINNAHYSIDWTLNNTYDTDFANTWVDFISKNLYNGMFNDMNNDIYYYSDQINANPINSHTSEINFSSNQYYSSYWYSNQARIIKYIPQDDFFINILSTGPFYSQIAIVSSNQNNVISETSADDFYRVSNDDSDTIYVIGTHSGSTAIGSIELLVFEYDYGDINMDNIFNVIDVVALINHIFNINPLSGLPLVLADMNFETIYDVIDIVAIINVILDS